MQLQTPYVMGSAMGYMPAHHPPPQYYSYSAQGYPPVSYGYHHQPPLHGPHVELPHISSPQSRPNMAHGSSSAVAGAESVDEWCRRHSLGEDERQGLIKLGFKVGDKLDDLTNDLWEWAGLAPLCRMRILVAYRTG